MINDSDEVFKVTNSNIKIKIPLYSDTFPGLVNRQSNNATTTEPASRIMICVIWGGWDAVRGSEIGK
jgi:hypothetical protein